MGTDSPASRASTCRYSIRAHQGALLLSQCTERLNTSLAAQAMTDIKTQSSRDRPQRAWEEFSALAAPFGDERYWSCGFVSMILTDSPLKMKPSREQVTEGDN